MGYYINPQNDDKERWLQLHSRVMQRSVPTSTPEGSHWVVLVNNNIFTAAGIAYDSGELEAFSREDGRAKFFFLVPDEDLIAVCPEVARVLK